MDDQSAPDDITKRAWAAEPAFLGLLLLLEEQNKITIFNSEGARPLSWTPFSNPSTPNPARFSSLILVKSLLRRTHRLHSSGMVKEYASHVSEPPTCLQWFRFSHRWVRSWLVTLNFIPSRVRLFLRQWMRMMTPSRLKVIWSVAL